MLTIALYFRADVSMRLAMAVPAPVVAMGGEGDAHIDHTDEESDADDDEIFESTRNSLLKLSSVLKRKRSLSLSDCGGPSNKFPDIEDRNDNMKDDSNSEAQGERAASNSHAAEIMEDDNMDFDDDPRRPMLECYHLKIYGNQKRDFQKSWLVKHQWLCYRILLSMSKVHKVLISVQ